MLSWAVVTKMVILYAGSAVLFSSLFGCLMNVIIFSSFHMYRSQPCTFYLLIAALTRFTHLLMIGIPRGIAILFNVDLTLISLEWCKMRFYIVSTCFGLEMTFECLATIDRFLITSRKVYVRQLSNIKMAHRVTAGLIAVWLLQNIPYLIFVNISSNICAIYNDFWQLYSTYVNRWVLYTAVPLIVCIVFGILAHRNMRSLKRSRQLQKADRQLFYMIFGQIIATVLPVIPSAVFNVYSPSAISVNQAAERDSDYFAFNLLNVLCVLCYGSTFFIFIIVSSIFRSRFKQRFSCCSRHRNLPDGEYLIVFVVIWSG
ncbi:unnamed protein product [Adineta ricciae]|uniref:G-protein coupled receptors family 1 profile domain-containing protein n=1 Tax=Adineta ricciae TaxID=249248 RepID=A0A815JYJ4_ADIRI|nr:unnamed protein product [Adineta ricciae]